MHPATCGAFGGLPLAGRRVTCVVGTDSAQGAKAEGTRGAGGKTRARLGGANGKGLQVRPRRRRTRPARSREVTPSETVAPPDSGRKELPSGWKPASSGSRSRVSPEAPGGLLLPTAPREPPHADRPTPALTPPAPPAAWRARLLAPARCPSPRRPPGRALPSAMPGSRHRSVNSKQFRNFDARRVC